jgi:hypothetical protein
MLFLALSATTALQKTITGMTQKKGTAYFSPFIRKSSLSIFLTFVDLTFEMSMADEGLTENRADGPNTKG